MATVLLEDSMSLDGCVTVPPSAGARWTEAGELLHE